MAAKFISQWHRFLEGSMELSVSEACGLDAKSRHSNFEEVTSLTPWITLNSTSQVIPTGVLFHQTTEGHIKYVALSLYTVSGSASKETGQKYLAGVYEP